MARKLKVLLVSHEPNLIGGSERSLLEIAKYLHNNKNTSVTVVAPAGGSLKEALETEHIPCDVVSYRWAIYDSDKRHPESLIEESLPHIYDIKELLERRVPDVVMTNNSIVPWFAYACSLMSIPHVWFIREFLVEDGALRLYPNYRDALSFISQSSVKILVNSQFMKGYYEQALQRDDIAIIYPAIDKDILTYASVRPRTKPNIIKLIVYGAIIKDKNQLEALRAVVLLKKQGVINFHLSIMGPVGDVQYDKKLRSFVKKNSLDTHVSFLPHSAKPWSIVTTHDICIVPSLHEPFGRVSVEAMLLGKIVVASDTGGNKEVLRAAKGTFMYHSGDATALAKTLAQLIREPESFSAFGEAAHNYAAKKFLKNDSLELLQRTLQESAFTKSSGRNWVGDALLVLAREHLELKVMVASLNDTQYEQAQKITKLQSRLQAKETQLDLLLNSKRWQFLSSTLKPLDWARRHKRM